MKNVQLSLHYFVISTWSNILQVELKPQSVDGQQSLCYCVLWYKQLGIKGKRKKKPRNMIGINRLLVFIPLCYLESGECDSCRTKSKSTRRTSKKVPACIKLCFRSLRTDLHFALWKEYVLKQWFKIADNKYVIVIYLFYLYSIVLLHSRKIKYRKYKVSLQAES